jgi:hypothetical protein
VSGCERVPWCDWCLERNFRAQFFELRASSFELGGDLWRHAEGQLRMAIQLQS